MKNLGYYNGKIDLIENILVPMNDRVCFFGDGVYDAGPAHNYRIFACDEHIDRFYRSAAALNITIPMEKAELKALLYDLIKRLDTGDLFVYYQVTRGTAPRNHTFDPAIKGNMWVTMKPANIADATKPLQLITTEDTRFFHCNIKTLNLIPSVMAAQKAELAGCGEAVFYRPGGRVTECAHSNVSILKDGVLRTAPTDNLILPGIARAHLIKACKKLGVPVCEEAFTLDDLATADEIIVTSSSKLCLRSNMLDGKPVCGKALELYDRIEKEVMREFLAETEA